MDTTLLVLSGLAVWRVTHLLHAEAGPGQALERLRQAAGIGLVGQALACFYCLSLWVAAPLALWLAEPWPERALLWLGLSAVAILLERVTTAREASVAVASYQEDAAPAQEQRALFP